MKKRATIDPDSRIDDLLDKAEPMLQRRFLDIVKQTESDSTINQVEVLLAEGRNQDALELLDTSLNQFASEVTAVYILSGVDTTDFINKSLGSTLDFDVTDPITSNLMRNARLNIVNGLTQQQRLASQTALIEGIQKGLNPSEQAKLLRESIGLNPQQVKAVNNYRSLLEQGSLQALDRQLRDKSFDSKVREARSVPLTKPEIDRMVDRYRDRNLAYRADLIAKSEALSAVNEAVDRAYNQAIETGIINPAQLVRTWHTKHDGQVRSSHVAMNEQKRGMNVPFLSGNGNSLMYPGDPSAPADDILNCRCTLSTQIEVL